MRIEIPEDVRYIIETLGEHGHEAFAVGGCVRDVLLCRKPQDWDITTSAKPEEVKALFRRTVDTGIAHGTVTVMLNHEGYEVTTYRIDGKYSDSRHPESVTFTPELREDLRRRDFTINAMAYNHAAGIQDLFGGREDLKARVIRAVGEPEERFSEDALRIMRCVRFAAQLGFTIEPATYEAAKTLAPTLENISRERVREELLKILLSDHPDYLELLEDIGALSHMLPEYAAYRASGGAARAFSVISALPKERVLRLTALLSDIPGGAETADRFLGELKFDNDTRKRTVVLVKTLKESVPETPAEVRLVMNRIGDEACDEYLKVLEAGGLRRDGAACNSPEMADAIPGPSVFDADRGRLAAFRRMYEAVLAAGECTSMRDLAVTGGDLISRGMKPGKQMGAVLNALLLSVLEDPSLNERETLIRRAFELSGRRDGGDPRVS